MRQLAQHFWDKLGILITSLCALHCLLLPLLLPLLSVIGLGFLASTGFELTVLICSMFLGGFALWQGYKHQHGRIFPFFLLAAGGTIYGCKELLGERTEPYLVAIGALFIVLAHISNMKLHRVCEEDACQASHA